LSPGFSTLLFAHPPPSPLDPPNKSHHPNPHSPQLTSLESLSLAGTNVGAAGLSALGPLSRLTSLDASAARNVGDAAAGALAALPQLESLTVEAGPAAGGGEGEGGQEEGEGGGGGGSIGPAGLAALAHVPGLRRLDLGLRAEVDDASLEALAGGAGARGGAGWGAGPRPIRVFGGISVREGGPHTCQLAFPSSLPPFKRQGCSALASLSVGSFKLSRRPPPAFGATLERLAFGGGRAHRGLHLLLPLPRLRALALTVGARGAPPAGARQGWGHYHCARPYCVLLVRPAPRLLGGPFSSGRSLFPSSACPQPAPVAEHQHPAPHPLPAAPRHLRAWTP
jgi:hypothetical protein